MCSVHSEQTDQQMSISLHFVKFVLTVRTGQLRKTAQRGVQYIQGFQRVQAQNAKTKYGNATLFK